MHTLLQKKSKWKTDTFQLLNFGIQQVRKVTRFHFEYLFLERLQNLGSTFYRTADCCVFVFDVSNESSFHKLDSLKDFFWSVCDKPKMRLIVIGNKTDAPNRKVTAV